MSDKTVEIIEQNKSVTVQQDGQTVVIDEATIQVVSVGTQGPAGPSLIGGKGIPSASNPPSDGDLLRYDSATDVWAFTQEIDAGTY